MVLSAKEAKWEGAEKNNFTSLLPWLNINELANLTGVYAIFFTEKKKKMEFNYLDANVSFSVSKYFTTVAYMHASKLKWKITCVLHEPLAWSWFLNKQKYFLATQINRRHNYF